MTSHQKSEQKAALAFLAFLVFVSLPVWAPTWLLPLKPLSTRVAGSGGLIALSGVFLMARPVWRLGGFWGPFNYISLRVFMDIIDLDDPLMKKMLDERERVTDDILLQVLGPLLVGTGTVINAFSGYLGS
jgi:hypothetical protein